MPRRPALAHRRLPAGAEVQPGGGVHFRVWAPRRQRIEVIVASGPGADTQHELDPEPGGWFSGLVPAAGAGSRYLYALDGAELFPDPASRCQPEGPHRASEVIDPAAYVWRDAGFAGAPERPVAYELHVGTFTPEGTFAAAAERLPYLRDLGITVVNVMPINEFDGAFGWGYDGVSWFAPYHGYGRPDDVRRFVDAAHGFGLGVVLDVVYNHFGPSGNYVAQYSDGWYSDRYTNAWGRSLDYESHHQGHGGSPVRQAVCSSAAAWIAEYHFDGLRLDATQDVRDASAEHVVAQLVRTARAAAGDKRLWIVAEAEPQDTLPVRPPDEGGWGCDAVWNDDFHHAAHVALTGKTDAYYADYRGTPQELVAAVERGYLYQGQYYTWLEQRRGRSALDLPPRRFVHYLQNHDQVANSSRGWRIDRLAHPGSLRALTAVLLLGPPLPMLFQGQEFAASAPFRYFADHEPDLAAKVWQGRRKFLAGFRRLASVAMQGQIAAPHDPEQFRGCKLDWREVEAHADVLALHRDLLRLRRDDPVLGPSQPEGFDGAVLTDRAFCLRWFGPTGHRLLVVNLGADATLAVCPEPLLAPPHGHDWQVLWQSEDPRYGGEQVPSPDTGTGWWLPAHAAVLLQAAPGP